MCQKSSFQSALLIQLDFPPTALVLRGVSNALPMIFSLVMQQAGNIFVTVRNGTYKIYNFVEVYSKDDWSEVYLVHH